jgi:hypothetical protein
MNRPLNLESPHTITASLFWEQTLYKAVLFSIFIAIPLFWSIRKHIDKKEERSATKKARRGESFNLPESSHPTDRSWQPKKQDWKRRTNRLAFKE